MKNKCTNIIVNNTRIYRNCSNIEFGENNSVRFFCEFDGTEVTIVFSQNVIFETKYIDSE